MQGSKIGVTILTRLKFRSQMRAEYLEDIYNVHAHKIRGTCIRVFENFSVICIKSNRSEYLARQTEARFQDSKTG